ncbi:hypothetical protein D3C80_1238660 [compost metagenome]
MQRTQAIRPGKEFSIGGKFIGLACFDLLRKIADRDDSVLLCLFLAHGKGVSVVGLGRVQPGDAFLRIKLADFFVRFVRAELVHDFIVSNQRSAGVFPIHIDLTILLRRAQNGRTQVRAFVDIVAIGAQELSGHLGNQLLLGKLLAADHNRVIGRSTAHNTANKTQGKDQTGQHSINHRAPHIIGFVHGHRIHSRPVNLKPRDTAMF